MNNNDRDPTPTTGSSFDPIKIADQVRITFDWQVPITSLVMFETRIERGGQISTINFEVDRAKLSPVQLKRLEDFLSRRPTWTVVEVARVSAWLLGISLEQSQPSLSATERVTMVRTLLLADAQVQTAAKE